jgi:pimeloyl-ACP methyl ester carboxylesterase
VGASWGRDGSVAAMDRQRHEIEGPGGRRLVAEIAGPSRGDVVLAHTGTPEAGTVYELKAAAGAERGLRHLSYSRPGYGGSERQPGRTVADCAADVVAIADALGIERFYAVGQSGGGPHALACAALLADRVRAAATLGGVAPRSAAGLDWLAGMGEENLEEFGAAEAGEAELRALLERVAPEFAAASAEELRGALGDLIGEADKAVLTGEYAEHLVEGLRGALAGGIWGWFDDDLAIFADWGFDLGAIAVPVTVWQGDDDRMVPFAHGEWLAAHVAGASPRLLTGEGHLSIEVTRYGDVLDDLLERGA